MYAVEFQTEIHEGRIELPEEYKTRFSNRVRVILLAEEEKVPNYTLIDQLLAQPIHLPGFTPLSREEIYAR